MIPGSANPLLLATAVPTGYNIERSLRFNSSDSAYLSRTPASAGNRKTWTWAGWVKLGTNFGSRRMLFGGGTIANSIPNTYLEITDSAQLGLDSVDPPSFSTAARVRTTAALRDPSAWYHIVFSVDTTQATTANRIKIYINGTEQTSYISTTYPSQNYDTGINSTQIQTIGAYPEASYRAGLYLDGYIADIHFIDGQALDPSSFTEVSATTGQLIPKAYTGSYGTNGFHLPFSDNSTAAALGTDTSGNSNTWTVNNLSIITGGPTSVAAASGALPVYNTTDTYGTTKGTGTRTDSNSSSIVLAVPMDGTNGGTTFTDESATIKGSGSPKSLTVNNATTSTSAPKYYGSSGNFDGVASAKYLSFSPGTDLEFGTGDFTVEAWVNMTSRTTSNNQFVFNTSGGTQIALYQGLSYGYERPVIRVGATDVAASTAVVTYGTWQHWAATRSGSTVRLFINGVLQSTGSDSTNVTAQTTAYVGGNGSLATSNTNGYIQDFRIYKGVAKYTSNFNPPSSTQNASIAAGNDSLVDSPTNYGTDSGAGGEVRGNYATLNPLKNNSNNVLSNGNLTAVNSVSSTSLSFATIALPKSGKHYFEGLASANGGSTNVQIGIFSTNHALTATGSKRYWYLESGGLYDDGTLLQSVATYTNGDLIGVAFNADANTVTWYKNGVQQGTAVSVSTSYDYVFGAGIFRGQWDLNFGQRPFAYTAPSGFKALCTTNLPEPTIADGSTAMDVKLYTGNGSTQTISGLNFSPDLVWVKARVGTRNHVLSDTIRGTNNVLASNTTAAQVSPAVNGQISAFNSDGFAVAAGTSDALETNNLNDTYVAWTWDAGSSTVTNTQGSITSQVRANASAGFSVATWTGTGSGSATVGHGLGVAPRFMIVKDRNLARNWIVYHTSLGATSGVVLSGTSGASGADAGWWNNTAPTSTVATIGIYGNEASNYVGYFWTPVSGYSSFGSYTGNGSADGPFVYTGFRPRWIMIKNSSASGDSWVMHDTARNTYNVVDALLMPNQSTQETTSTNYYHDILSNGFKLRTTLSAYNGSGATYIYAAFAESPFQYARAR